MLQDSVAIYWDFENIHAGIYDTRNGSNSYRKKENREKAHEVLVDIEELIDFSSTFGNIVINKAYCNWQWFYNYKNILLKSSIELIQIFPPGASAKNGADIKLSLDAVEDIIRFPHISHIVVIGGDSDFIPLAQKIKASGKLLIGVGCEKSTNKHWANSCTEFKFYETIVDISSKTIKKTVSSESLKKNPVETVKEAIRRVGRKESTDDVLKAKILPMVKRLDPTFDPERYGCKTFTEFLRKNNTVFKVDKGEYDHIVSIIEV